MNAYRVVTSGSFTPSKHSVKSSSWKGEGRGEVRMDKHIHVGGITNDDIILDMYRYAAHSNGIHEYTYTWTAPHAWKILPDMTSCD